MAVRGKTTNESQPCNQGRKSDNQKGSKRQEGHVSDWKAKGLRFRRLLAWLDVEIAHQQNNNPMTKRQKALRRKLRREFHSINLNVLIRAQEQTLLVESTPLCTVCLGRCTTEGGERRSVSPRLASKGSYSIHPKKGDPKSAANYRPIACLNTMYKAVTAFIASELLTYTLTNDLLPMAQRAMRKERWRCVDCLLLDQTIGLDAKITGKPLSVAWIDYEKAYDRVPHKCVMKVLKTINCPGWIQRSIELFFKDWATVFELRTAGKVVRSTLLNITGALPRRLLIATPLLSGHSSHIPSA